MAVLYTLLLSFVAATLAQQSDNCKCECNPTIAIRTGSRDKDDESSVMVTTEFQSEMVKTIFENVTRLLLEDQQTRYTKMVQIVAQTGNLKTWQRYICTMYTCRPITILSGNSG